MSFSLGKGFYSYDPVTQKKSNDPAVEAIVRELSADANFNIQLLCDEVDVPVLT